MELRGIKERVEIVIDESTDFNYEIARKQNQLYNLIAQSRRISRNDNDYARYIPDRRKNPDREAAAVAKRDRKNAKRLADLSAKS